GNKVDSFYGMVGTGKIWSHAHVDHDPVTGRQTETYERANNGNGELKERVKTVFDPATRKYLSGHIEADRDENGSLETSYDFKPY
ncbi:MAG: hypothetical protein ACYC8T_37105, partial [Myxococcaceae bacterium]